VHVSVLSKIYNYLAWDIQPISPLPPVIMISHASRALHHADKLSRYQILRVVFAQTSFNAKRQVRQHGLRLVS